MKFRASARNFIHQKEQFRSAEGLCSKAPELMQTNQVNLALREQAQRLYLSVPVRSERLSAVPLSKPSLTQINPLEADPHSPPLATPILDQPWQTCLP
jgi:hypothetical protein